MIEVPTCAQSAAAVAQADHGGAADAGLQRRRTAGLAGWHHGPRAPLPQHAYSCAGDSPYPIPCNLPTSGNANVMIRKLAPMVALNVSEHSWSVICVSTLFAVHM